MTSAKRVFYSANAASTRIVRVDSTTCLAAAHITRSLQHNDKAEVRLETGWIEQLVKGSVVWHDLLIEAQSHQFLQCSVTGGGGGA